MKNWGKNEKGKKLSAIVELLRPNFMIPQGRGHVLRNAGKKILGF